MFLNHKRKLNRSPNLRETAGGFFLGFTIGSCHYEFGINYYISVKQTDSITVKGKSIVVMAFSCKLYIPYF